MSREALDDAATLFRRPSDLTPVDADGRSITSFTEPHDETVVAPLARPAAVGDVIGDKYRLLQTLGRGGMGRIFAAEHLMLGTKVALKFMHPHLTRDRGQVARFAREARAAAILQSVHAARIIDVDQLPNGELYIVMEYLEGVSLDTLATEGRGLPIADAVTYVIQACDALAEAHSRSIVHRDVKPANLFLTKNKSGEPHIKVLDFGLAKSLAPSTFSQDATMKGQALGTPYYMSPEQITGAAPVDGRSDVWAIGVTLYELLTGHLAFGGNTAAVVFDSILQGRPTPLRVHRPDVPEALVAIVEKCMALEASNRFQTVRELTRVLQNARDVPFEPVTRIAHTNAPSGMRFAQPSRAPLPTPAPPPPTAPMRQPYASLPPPPLQGPPRFASDAVAHVQPLVPPERVGPSTAQTIVAALAGPALVVVIAGVAALVMAFGGIASDPGTIPTVAPAKVTFAHARSTGTLRQKASSEHPRR